TERLLFRPFALARFGPFIGPVNDRIVLEYIKDVVADLALEEMRVARGIGDAAARQRLRQGQELAAIDGDAAALRPHQAGYGIGERFAAVGGADDGDAFAWPHVERDVLEQPCTAIVARREIDHGDWRGD